MRREITANHMHIKRSLINLPGVSVGGTLGTLLSPIIGDGNTPAASPSAPAPAPASGGGGDNGGGDSGGNGNGGNGNGNGGNGNGGNGNGGNGNGGNDNGGNGNGGNGNGGNDNGGGNSGGGSSDGGSSGSSSGSSSSGSTSSEGGSNGSSSGSGGGGNSSGGSGSGSTGGGNGSSNAGTSPTASSPAPGGSAAVGGVAGSSGTSGASTTAATGAVGNIGSSPPGGNNTNSNSPGTSSLSAIPSARGTGTVLTVARTAPSTGGAQNPSATGSSASAGGVSKPGLSSGGIAGVAVVVVLGLVVLVVAFLRRRSIAKRAERRDQWFAGYSSTSLEGGAPSRTRSAEAAQVSGNASIRSSFATTYDHGVGLTPDKAPPFSLSALNPEFPPMAEIRNNSGILHNNGNNGTKEISRFSTGSGNSQYLYIPEASGSMSVQPFSPSETFSFPEPPSGTGERLKGLSPENEKDWLPRLGSDPAKSPNSQSGRTLTAKQSVAPAAAAAALSSPPSSYPYSGNHDNTSGDTNYHSIPSPSPEPGFKSVEIIRRPFEPTLDDELAVVPGDSVRIVKTFDDGWAYIEKIGTSAKGLIPVDCLRDAGQDLPTFIASKRISSYISEDSVMGMGTAA